MHELTITESILKIAIDHAEQNGARKVTDLHLIIGQLSSIVDDSVQFYWDIISANTICQGAKLHFERIPAQLNCLDCGETYTIPNELSPCPKCRGIRVKTVHGDEFRLDSIEIE